MDGPGAREGGCPGRRLRPRRRRPPTAPDHDRRGARRRHVRPRRHHRPRLGRSRPRRQRDHQRHPPGRAAGAVLPGGSRRSARWSTWSARSTSSRRSSGERTGSARSSTRARSGCTGPDDADAADRSPGGARDRPPAQPLRGLQARERGQRPGLLARRRPVEHRPPTDDGVRGRPRPGDDERADEGDRGGPPWRAVHDRVRRLDAVPVRRRRRADAPRGEPEPARRRPCVQPRRKRREHVGLVDDHRVDRPRGARPHHLRSTPLPFPAEIDHDGLAALGPVPVTPFADGVAASAEIYRDLARRGRLIASEQGLEPPATGVPTPA